MVKKPYAWQLSSWQQITQAVKANRLHHALLLQGLVGMGKQGFAHALAQYILCLDATDYACGVCRSCRLFTQQSHIDLYVIAPQEAGGWIKIDALRALQEKLSLTPSVGARRVVIMESVHRLHHAASHALLKTLEEPGQQIYFLLESSAPHQLPATIVSRCQPLCFRGAAQDTAITWLEQEVPDQEKRRYQYALACANGAPLEAKRILQNVDDDLPRQLPRLLMDKKLTLAAFMSGVSTYPPQEVACVIQLWAHALLCKRYGVDSGMSVGDIAWKSASIQAIFGLWDGLHAIVRDIQAPVEWNKKTIYERLYLCWYQHVHKMVA